MGVPRVPLGAQHFSLIEEDLPALVAHHAASVWTRKWRGLDRDGALVMEAVRQEEEPVPASAEAPSRTSSPPLKSGTLHHDATHCGLALSNNCSGYEAFALVVEYGVWGWLAAVAAGRCNPGQAGVGSTRIGRA